MGLLNMICSNSEINVGPSAPLPEFLVTSPSAYAQILLNEHNTASGQASLTNQVHGSQVTAARACKDAA